MSITSQNSSPGLPNALLLKACGSFLSQWQNFKLYWLSYLAPAEKLSVMLLGGWIIKVYSHPRVDRIQSLKDPQYIPCLSNFLSISRWLQFDTFGSSVPLQSGSYTTSSEYSLSQYGISLSIQGDAEWRSWGPRKVLFEICQAQRVQVLIEPKVRMQALF